MEVIKLKKFPPRIYETEYNRKIYTAEQTKSKTQQEYKDKVNIHRIIKDAYKGITPNTIVPNYQDCTKIQDIQTTMNHVAYVNEVFNTLPADIKKKYNNDPEKFLVSALETRSETNGTKQSEKTKMDNSISKSKKGETKEKENNPETTPNEGVGTI